MTARTVSIHYHRLPGRSQVFRQAVLEETTGYTVTFLESADLAQPLLANAAVILEPGSPIVWFTYPGTWYDIGRFHLADGTFTGFYANVLTPVRMQDSEWETTDLCLDVWMGAAGDVLILDQDDFDQAVARGWMDAATAKTARETARALSLAAREGRWPPQHVYDWPLERARQAGNEV